MSKHMQGPWCIRPDGNGWRAVHDGIGCSAYQAVMADDEAVALVVAHGADPWSDAPPTEHNARLIAAAPELLEALQMLLRYTLACEAMLNATPAGQIDIARAAIAKATGA